ncbi:MAG: 5-formyltetrahydrofolate cyclo-ligase [Anaerolineae bacterium]|nr:5-formyltetrahydrofolate cyclo-ligase [Anaerolineae bacterium]
MDKSELRAHFCSLREGLPAEEVAAASVAICRGLARWLADQLPNQPTILTYLAFRNEPDLSLLFELLPDARWIVPRIMEGRHMALHSYDPSRLVRHRFGMLEPAADLPTVDPAGIDAALVPGVAFDRQGGRLGFGGGYYDCFLSTTPALRIGIAFDQCLARQLPRGEHDQRMDWVATQSKMIDCGRMEWKPS